MFATAKQIHAGGKELQDRVEIFELGSRIVLAAADGAGGRSGGAEAAEFLVRSIGRAIQSVELSPDGLVGLLKSIDQQMIADGNLGETTCVICIVSKDGVIGASVGDSGAWCVSENGIDNLTDGQVRKPFMGTGDAMPVGFVRAAFKGTLLIASDGLLKYTSSERIVAVVLGCDLDKSAQALVELVRYPSGALPDDVSVLLSRET